MRSASIRTDIGLNATFGASIAAPRPSRARRAIGRRVHGDARFRRVGGIGFSTVVALGGGIDVGFGELLDALLHDAETDGILLYVEVGRRRAARSCPRCARRRAPSRSSC